jgi:hypothetical protein
MSRLEPVLPANVAGQPGLLAAALEFAEIGVRVVIVQGKNPGGFLGRHWEQQATRDPAVLCGWWERWPDVNVGILGDAVLLPLDVDNPDSFERFQAEHGQAPPTPRFYTGGSQAIQDALGVLGGRALFDGVEHKVHVRTAEHDGRIFLDLADPEWREVAA